MDQKILFFVSTWFGHSKMRFMASVEIENGFNYHHQFAYPQQLWNQMSGVWSWKSFINDLHLDNHWNALNLTELMQVNWISFWIEDKIYSIPNLTEEFLISWVLGLEFLFLIFHCQNPIITFLHWISQPSQES